MSQLPDKITFDITIDDIEKANELISMPKASFCSSCVVAVAVNRWLRQSGINAKVYIDISDIEIWIYNQSVTIYKHSTESKNAMDKFYSKQPVEPCTTTIRRRQSDDTRRG